MAETTERTKITAELVKRWKERLFLGHWLITWEWAQFDDTMGTCNVTPGRCRAVIEIDINLDNWETLRHTVVHELTHCAFGRTLRSIDTLDSSQSIGKPVWDAWHAQFREIHEVDIDQMTVVLCNLCDDEDLEKQWTESRALAIAQ